MIKIKKKATLPVPPDEVFAFLCDPDRMRSLSRYEIDDVSDLPNGLHRTTSHRTRRDGVVMHRVSEGIEMVPNSRVVVRAYSEPFGNGRLEVLLTRELTPAGKGTLITSEIEARVRPGYVGRFTPRRYGGFKQGTDVGHQRLLAAIIESFVSRTAQVNPEPEAEDHA